MNPTQIIRQYLSFSRGEQRGIFLLILLILVINLLRAFLPDLVRLDPADFSAFSMEIDQFERSLEEADRKKQEQEGGYAFAGRFPQDLRSLQIPNSVNYSDTTGSASRLPAYVIELNRADTLDLQRLRGIGPSFARRITGYRAKLGGFISVDQLLEVYGMDSSRFLGIRRNVRVDTSGVQRMNLNAVSFKDLIAHPYMPYELAKEIAVYVKKHKGIRELEEVQRMKHCDSALFVKLKPYLGINVQKTNNK